MAKRLHVYISGKVQGVSFRAFARDQAKALGVRGYAKNLAGGQLEILVEGGDAQVDEFLAWCRRGPALAQVQGVSVAEEEIVQGEYTQFSIRY